MVHAAAWLGARGDDAVGVACDVLVTVGNGVTTVGVGVSVGVGARVSVAVGLVVAVATAVAVVAAVETGSGAADAVDATAGVLGCSGAVLLSP